MPKIPNDIIHPASEFHKIPWDRLPVSGCARDWGVGRGGNGLPDNTYNISEIHEDGHCDIWVLPDQLRAIIDMMKDIERRRTKQDIQVKFYDFTNSFER